MGTGGISARIKRDSVGPSQGLSSDLCGLLAQRRCMSFTARNENNVRVASAVDHDGIGGFVVEEGVEARQRPRGQVQVSGVVALGRGSGGAWRTLMISSEKRAIYCSIFS